ncbi:MAG: VanW family protein [Caldilinea sp.]|nr:VanW family protein [Caldilinea sp.]
MQQVLYPSHRTRIRRTALDMTVILLLLTAFAAATLVAAWGFWHTGRIYTGVSVGGAPIGGLTRAEAYRRLNETLYQYPLPPVTLVHDGAQWPLPTTQVRARADLLDAVNRAYLYGRSGALLIDVVNQLGAAWRGVEITPQVVIDQEALRNAVATVAANVNRPGIGERRLGDIVIAAQPGVAVDVEATVQTVLAALTSTRNGAVVQAPLIVQSIAAPESATIAPSVVPTSSEIRPLVLRSTVDAFSLALSPADLHDMILSTEGGVVLDEARLRHHLEALAAQIERRPRDARLRFNPETGAVTVLSPSFPGRALDVDATVAAVRDAIANNAGEASLVIKTVAPAVDMNRIAEMGIRERVASGRSYFAGSSASRIRNIEVAAEQFEGVVIPPNGIFSFNDIVRDVSSANGFEDSLVIWGDRTAVGVGGGVCQVSTTVFRAAYEGGFPIVERYNHGYVVDWYGEPGLDATIFTPTVDFRFRNDTGAYLLIDPVVDSANGVITFNFYGTRPNRTVTVSKPEITDVIKPEAPVYTVDESLAPGQIKQVEWQKDGMTVTVTRTIVENGATRTDTLRSKYQPWRAVYLVGPGTETPSPAATPTGN